MLGYNEYVTSVLRGIAAGLGITYESLAGITHKLIFLVAVWGGLSLAELLKFGVSASWSLIFKPHSTGFLKFSSLKGLSTDNVSFVHVAPSREMIDQQKKSRRR